LISNLAMVAALLAVVVGSVFESSEPSRRVAPVLAQVEKRPRTSRPRPSPSVRVPPNPLRPPRRSRRSSSVREGSVRSSGWGSSSRRSFSGGGFSSGK